MTELYLIRHAQAEGNLYRRIHGQYDSLLTETGQRQVEALEARFQPVHIDAVYASDLIRAKQTAAAIYRPKGLPLHTTPALREMNLGVWEDRCWGEVEQTDPEQIRLFNTEPEKWRIAGGEPWADVARRMEGAVLDIARDNPGKSVAAVSHGTAIRALLTRVLGVRSGDIVQVPHCENTGVTLLEVEDGRIAVRYMNDDSHLPDELNSFRREGWWKQADGRDGRNMYFLPFDLRKEGEAYLDAYRDAWIAAHGTDRGFDSAYLAIARGRAAKDPASVARAWLEGEPCGVVELAPESGAREGVGHIAFLYLLPAFRGRGLAPQLLGYALSYYRRLGRGRLRLKVAEDNRHAQAFYLRNGFVRTGSELGVLGPLLIMEKDIERP